MKLYILTLPLFLILFACSNNQVTSDGQVSSEKIILFNGEDLTGWNGDMQYWRVEDGVIIGQFTEMEQLQFLHHHQELEDFRLILKVRTVDGKGNSGIQFRSEALPNGYMRGPQADIGEGYWGKLYEELGRTWLWEEDCDHHVDMDGWNEYEVLAVDSRIQTAINGNLCVDLDDPYITRKGVLGLQLHSGFAPAEIHFRDFELELNPEFKLTTLD